MKPITTHEELIEALSYWRCVETLCTGCGGSGVKTYGNTATYHKASIAGQALTNGVCDKCWGSGDAHKPWQKPRDVYTIQERTMKNKRFEVDFEQQCFPEKKLTEDLYALDFDAARKVADFRLEELIGYGVFDKATSYVASIRCMN